jgi:hypothetical protein
LTGATIADGDLASTLLSSAGSAERRSSPFTNWRMHDVLPEEVARAASRIEARPVELCGVSGRRELHNDQRVYFAGEVLDRVPVARQIAEAFQAPAVVQALMVLTGAMLVGTYLRIELALDVDGFWLEPHTDLGVKAISMLLQLGRAGQEGIGTDLYFSPDKWAETVPFGWNSALVFVPASNTWHGVERRPIEGVRRSVIVNYVTDEWRAREQLAFPNAPVRGL